jgi:iron complex outermembrane receptor protein
MGINASAYYDWGKTFFFWNGLDSNGYKPYPNTLTIYKDYRFTIDPFIDYTDPNGNHIKVLTRFLNATNTNTTGQGSVPDRYYGELQYIRKFDLKHNVGFNFVAGVVNVYDHVTPPADAASSLFGKNTAYNFSAYAQTDFKFFNKLNVSFGARWEYFDMIHYVQDSTAPGGERLVSNQNSLNQLPYPLFRAGLNYQAAEATYIRASFGQGFRYPSIAERYITTQVGPLYISSDPNLQPEKGYGAELGIKQGFKLGSDWLGFADLSGFWNRYDNMMEFTFGQFGDTASWHTLNTSKNQALGLGFSSQNIGETQIFGTEFDLGGQGKLGPVGIQMICGYTYIDPRSLNWNTPIKLYNYQGAQILPYATLPSLGLSLPLFNEANNPNKTPGNNEITYGMTSTSPSNLLKYRSQHTLKVDLTFTYKELEINTNLQYASLEKSIDYAFISKAFTFIGPSAFGGLEQYMQEKMDIPIGQGRGEIDLNAYIAYNFKQGIRVAFVVKNLLNDEYTPRPAYFAEPRNFTAQLTYTFHGKTPKQRAAGG